MSASQRYIYMKIRESLLAQLREASYRPSGESDLASSLGLPKKQRSALSTELKRLVASRDIVQIKGQRYQLAPRDSREITGTIRFRAGGSAFIIRDQVDTSQPNQPEPPSIQISPDETDVALHGDRVAVKILPGVRTRRAGEVAGRITRIIERGRDTVVGNLRKSGRNWIVIPDDPRLIHEVVVKDPAHASLKPVPSGGDKVVVKLNEWKHRRDPLTGTLTSRLGRTHEPRAELLGIYEKYGLSPNFPEAVEREVVDLPDSVQPKEMKDRLDYRKVPTFTIDPDDAKDFDDAISIEELPQGEVRIGIHIADVSNYVKSDTALDKEAQSRGNSTYLVGTVIPMLPEKLSNGLCSLVEAENRLTKAVFLTFDRQGNIKERTFANTLIRSRKRLTYKQAYAFLFEDDLQKIKDLPLPKKHQTGSTGRALNSLTTPELKEIQKGIRLLWKLASGLREARMKKGSLDLDMPETKIYVDENGYADRLEVIQNDESHQLIEEFMLAANEAVAHLTRSHKLPSLYRVHDDPDAEKLDELRQLLATHDIHVGDLTNRPEALKLLRILRDHPQGYTLRTLFLRSLRKACYRSTPDGHYGLNKKDYTHFTSPIRRYSDLVVHRVFDRYLDRHEGQKIPADRKVSYKQAHMESLGAHLTLTEINSQDAERDSVKIKLLEFFERELSKQPKTIFTAIITDIRPNGFFIELEESMTFGLVPASTLRDDHYIVTDDGTAMVGRKTKRRYQLNDKIPVVVAKVDRFKRLIDFTVSTNSPAPKSGKPSPKKSSSQKSKPARPQPAAPKREEKKHEGKKHAGKPSWKTKQKPSKKQDSRPEKPASQQKPQKKQKFTAHATPKPAGNIFVPKRLQ